MLRDFYYALTNELKTLNIPVVYGVGRGQSGTSGTSGTYITVQHVDSFDNQLTFGMIDNDCFYQKIQCHIKCHALYPQSKLDALALAEQVKDLLVYDYFGIDYFRIVDITLDSQLFLYAGNVDAFTYVLTWTWYLGTSAIEMNSSSSSSSQSSSSSIILSRSSGSSNSSMSSLSSLGFSESSESLSSNGIGCQIYWFYTYTCATGLYSLRSHAECSDSINRYDFDWMIYENVPNDHITWASAKFFYDLNCG